MYYVVESAKTFEQAAVDLENAVKAHQFGVLHIHDLGQTLRSKGFEFAEQCRVFEVCSPAQASKVLTVDINLNMALPCRISVFSENGVTKIGMIRPEPMLATLSQDARLRTIAQQVETSLQQMINQAK